MLKTTPMSAWRMILIVLAISGIGLAGPVLAADSASEGIAAGNQTLAAALAGGDGAAAGALYTETAFLLPPNAELIKGWADISDYWKAEVEGGLTDLRLETLEIFEGEGVATEVGRYQVMDPNGEAVDSGKYIVVWKLEAGRWMLHRDIWNSSLPAQ